METIQDLGEFTFKALLKNSVKKFGNRPALALAGDEKEISYAELETKSLEVASLLTSLGLGTGSKVAIWGIGRPQWGISYLGIVNHGMTAVPLLPDFSEVEVISIFEHCKPDAIFVETRLFKKLINNPENEKKLPSIIISLEDFSILKNETGLTPDLNCRLPEVKIREEDTASIIYTSGTTGRSKGVELTHKNLVWCAIQGQHCHRINKYDRCLSFLPISHVYEFTIGFTMQILNGACVYYLGKPPVVSALLPAFEKVKPTIIISVPLIMEKIYKNKVLPEIKNKWILRTFYHFYFCHKIINRAIGKVLMKLFGGHLVFLGIGGSKIDERVERFMKDAKIPYAIGYGLTECSPLLAACGPKNSIPGTIGPVLPGVDLKIINKNSRGIGEVVAKGPNIMKGYYNAPDINASSFTTDADECGAGYYKTGDLGILKTKKRIPRLILKGRIKNMILGPNGENIYPEDIEFIINQHPVVNESLVVEDDKGLVALIQFDEEKLTAEIEKRLKIKLPEKFPALGDFTDAAKDTADTLIKDVLYQKEAILGEIQYFVNSQTNKSSYISKMQQINEFQKTASQKIKRFLYELRTKKQKA